MKGMVISFSLLFGAFVSAHAQKVTDADRRGFDELTPILIDVDNDDKLDRIQPRTYQTYNRQQGKRLLKRDIRNWITFDLRTSKGKRIDSFFTYRYGTAEESYWVYALIPAGDLNKDHRTDLIFYTGDDTGDETVTLVSRGNQYIIRSRKVSDPSDWFKNLD